MKKYSMIIFICIVLQSVMLPSISCAEDAQDKADAAVANILFEYEGATEFATYGIKEDGFVKITFARNIPDELYSELLAKLLHHPDIPGVLSGKDGPRCSIF